MALSITINKVAVAAFFAAGATVATAVASGGTTYVYSLATGSDKFAINSSTGVVTTIALMDNTNITSFSVTATEGSNTVTSDIVYPNVQAKEQSKFKRANIIYKITKDIDLNNCVLTIPTGCTLDFQGGSFTNGIIIGSGTKINAGLQKIFSISITVDGSWSIPECYVEWFGAKGDGTTDDSSSFREILNSFKDGVTIKLLDRTYLVSNVILPSNTIITTNNGVIKQKDFIYLTTTSQIPVNGTQFSVNDSTKINIGDVISINGASGVDNMIVVSKSGNNINVTPNRIVRGISEIYTGCKYSHAIGDKVTITPTVFYITSTLFYYNETDEAPYIEGVANIRLDGITFEGSKSSYVYDNYNVYDLVFGGIIFGYRTINTTITNCSFNNIFSDVIHGYGWNTGMNINNNHISNVGYVLPTNLSPQYRDSTSGITFHWDQRYTSTNSNHVSTNFSISDNTFNTCWNGGVFLSATNNGIVKGNLVDTFVSHGISLYGGDIGISTSNVTIVNNIVRNGRINGDTLALGDGIWCSGISSTCMVESNTISNCELGIHIGYSNNLMVSYNILSNIVGTYIYLQYYNNRIRIFNNMLMQSLNFESTENSKIIYLHKDTTSSIPTNIELIANTYSFPSTYKGNTVITIDGYTNIKVFNEYPEFQGTYIVPSNMTDKVLVVNCIFTSVNSPGLTMNNSIRIGCVNPSGIIQVADAINQFQYNDKVVDTIDSGLLSAFPASKGIGKTYYATDLNKLVVLGTERIIDSEGFYAAKSKGTTEERPVLEAYADGVKFYDTTLKKYIVWNGTAWVNMDGTALS